MGELPQLGVCGYWATALRQLCSDPKVQDTTYGAVPPLGPVAIRHMNSSQVLRYNIVLIVNPGRGPHIFSS